MREVYIIQASARVSLASNDDVAPVKLDVEFVENGSELAVAELAY